MATQYRHYVATLVFALLTCPVLSQDKKAISIEQVVSALLCDGKECRNEIDWLVGLKEKSAPIFLQLLADPKPIDDFAIMWNGRTDPYYTKLAYTGILRIVKLWKKDREQFLRPALEKLLIIDYTLSEFAIELLAEIATERDASPIVAILHNRPDGHGGPLPVSEGFYAAKCLSAIGGQNEWIALSAMVRSNRAKSERLKEKYQDTYKYEVERDKLKARLDALALKAKPAPPPVIDESATPLKRVLAALTDDTDAGKADRTWLTELKDKAFPAYHHILRDPKTKPATERELFLRLKATAGDRSAFVPFALARLAHEDIDLRIAALNLLQVVGTSRDTSPVVALLGDERQIVSDLAVETLVSIGGENDLIALDIWLQGASKKYEPAGLPRFYVQQRAQLLSRIEKERASRKGSKK